MNSDISAYQNDLSIMQTLYIVALLFGFEKVATTIYSLLFETIFSYGVALRSVFVLCGIAIFILGVRLFWSIGNIGDCILDIADVRLHLCSDRPARKLR